MDLEMMSLREKIGQLCMFGIDGRTHQAETINLLTNYHVGNILLSKQNVKNPKQVHHLTQNLQAYADEYPLLIAMEQAGGEENSLTKGVTLSPNQQTLGQINNRLYTRQIAQVVSEELRAMGVNMNIYPKANIAENVPTSYGASNKYTARHVVAAVQGCHKENVLATVRDFPGIGDLRVNVNASITHEGRLYKTALHPFMKAIEAGAEVITITNELTSYSETTEPTLFSPLVVQMLLREKLEFTGVVMTEDLLDEKITTYVSPAEAALRSIEAGADLLVLSHNETEQINVLEAINEAVKSERITEDRIDASLKRVLRLKENFITNRYVDFNQDVFRDQWSVKLETLLLEKALAEKAMIETK